MKRFNYVENDLNNINNNQNNNRIISPRIVNDQKIYYFNEANLNPNQNIIYKNLGINDNIIYSQNPNYPINFIQQKNPQYLGYMPPYTNQNNFYPVLSPNNIYYQNFIPPNNNYLLTDNNIYNNYQRNTVHQDNKKYNKHNINEIDQYKNGLKLNIANYETQYPMTYLNDDPFNSRRTYVQNYNHNIKNYKMNIKDSESDPYPKTFQKNKNRKYFNLSQINHMPGLGTDLPIMPVKNRSKSKNKEYTIKNIKKKSEEKFNNSSYNFHKKNKSQLDYNNSKTESISKVKNSSKNKRKINTRGRIEKYNNEYDNYHNYNIESKSNNKNKSVIKNALNVYEEKEKYRYKIKKFIDHLEQYYIISFHNYFNYFIHQLFLYYKAKKNKNKNSLLKRFQRSKNVKHSNNIANNYSPNRDSLNEKLNKSYINNSSNNFNKIPNNTYINIFRKVYIPKKNIGQVELNTNSLNINNNINNINYSYGHNKNKSLDFLPYINPYQNNTTYIDNRLNLSTEFFPKYNFNVPNYLRSVYKNNSIDKNNSNDYNRKSYGYMNKSHENLQNKLSPSASSFHKRINDSINKKSIIYVKPKPNKLNLKRIVINNKENNLNNINDNTSINYSNTISNVNSNNYIYSSIFNKKKQLNGNVLYNPNNNSFSVKNLDDLRSPLKKKFKSQAPHISDIAKEVIDDENANFRSDYNLKSDDNNINEVIGNEDLIEETIIKDICTYDKKLWVFIKYVISPRAKQNFLKLKVKRRLKNSNNEIIRLIPSHTDSIEFISPLSKFNHYSINNKLIMKEISEERDSQNNSNDEDDILNNIITNMVNILEGYKKQNILYFYNYFFNSVNFYDKDLTHKNIFKNILTDFQNYDAYNKYNFNNNSYYSNENSNNLFGNENNKTTRKGREHWKRNLFLDIAKIKIVKKYHEDNEDENYLSGKINFDREKMNNFNLNNLVTKCNSTRGRLSKSEIQKREINEKNKKQEKKIILLKQIILKNNKKIERKYFSLWKHNENRQNNISNEDKKDNNLIKKNLDEKINILKMSLIKYVLKNKIIVQNNKEHKEAEHEELEEEEEEDEKGEEK